MKKIINSADKKYVPVDTENLVLDDTPTEGSFNAVTSDGVAKAIAGGGGGGGTTYTAGDGISISEDHEVSARVDGTTIGVNESGELEALGGGEAFNPVAKNNIIILPDGSYIGNQQDAMNDPYFSNSGPGAYDSTYFFCPTSTLSGGVYLAGFKPWCYCQDWNYNCTIFIEGYPDAADYDGYIPVWCPDYSKPSVRLEYIAVHGDQHNLTRKCRSVNYPENLPESISCSGVKILPPPSSAPDFEVDTTKWNKVGDWSTVNFVHNTWYFGMYNPTTQQWLEFNNDNHRVALDHGYQLIPRYKVFVNIPAATSADAGKVLKIDSSGNPQWVTP